MARITRNVTHKGLAEHSAPMGGLDRRVRQESQDPECFCRSAEFATARVMMALDGSTCAFFDQER